ncbi:MAG: tetratricopeptide repeat protein [candidate division WOR-3 bacterium]|nr:MAG: tetratricopeptide repeat protein [candidate division WOR-3 bacterium]
MPDELTVDSGALIFATLADVYLSSGMVDEAISILKDGLSRNPSYTLAKIILGRAYYMKGDYDEALKILNQTYQDAPESENLNLYLGHCYKKAGKQDEAVKFYKATLKINPQNKEAKQEMEQLDVKAVPEEPVEPEVPAVDETVVQIVEEARAIGEREEPTIVPHVADLEEVRKPEPTVEKPPQPPGPEPVKEEFPVKAPEPIVAAPVAAEPPKKTEPEVIAPVQPAVPHAEEPVPVAPEPTTAGSIPLASLDEPMHRLLKNKTVRGALVCSKDGLPIQSYGEKRTDLDEMSAVIGAIYNEAQDSFTFLKEGDLEKFIIEKGDETLCVITAGDNLLVVITQPETKPGLVFVYARKIIDEIRELLG